MRVDVVWDVYKEDSLKTQTRQNRGYGSRLRVESNTKVPANWNSFLRCDENKTSLFQYLANALQEFHPRPQKQVISTYGQKALSATSPPTPSPRPDPRIAELRKMPQSFIIKLYSETQVSGRLGMSGGISPRHVQNPLSGERRKTLSITHHALSHPHPHIICTSFISSTDYNVFIVL